MAAGGTQKAPCAEDAPPLDVAQFNQTLELPALRVPSRRVGELAKNSEMKALSFRRRGLRNIVTPEGELAKTHRLALLQPGTAREALPEVARAMLDSGGAELVTYPQHLAYENFSAEECLQRVLPEGVEVPRGFETVGHLAHFNLRESQWPHRRVIGQIILDKNPCLKTVVTKVGSLSNEFRTFDMEVLAGKDDSNVTVCEKGLKLQFDFRKVYWNSRLSEERVRLLEKVNPEDIVCDLFAGVGAFALMCAEKGNQVFANDLNPNGAEAIRRNAALNRIDMTVYNQCARECVKTLGAVAAVRPGARVHVAMNLPELALDFLDAFREMFRTGVSALFSGTAVELSVHCYCFAREKENPGAEINPRLVAALGAVPAGVVIRDVRDVAPKKNMYCVEFLLPLRQADAKFCGTGDAPATAGGVAAAAAEADGAAGGPTEAKRQKTE